MSEDLNKKLAEHVVNNKTVYNGHIIKVNQEKVQIPGGQYSQRDIVYHAKGVCALVITNQDKMILEKQWREPVKQVTIETPAGKVDSRDNGSSKHAMLRELNEEVRIKPKTFKYICGSWSSPGFTDEYLDLYLAKDLQPVHTKLPRDKGEFLHLFSVSLPKAKQMIKDGKIKDSKTIMAIFYWQMLKDSLIIGK